MLVFCMLMFILLKKTSGLYFSKPAYRFQTVHNSSDGSVGKVYSLSNSEDPCPVQNTNYTISTRPVLTDTNVTSAKRLEDLGHVFEIDNSTGVIRLSTAADQILGTHSGIIRAEANCPVSGHSVQRATTNVTLLINDVTSEDRLEPNFHELCWGTDDLSFQVAENNHVTLVFGALRVKNQETSKTIYTVIKGSDVLSVNNTTSELSLLKSLDRETQDEFYCVVTCEVKSGSDVIYESNSTIRVTVLDVDDNPPMFEDQTQRKEENITVKTRQSLQTKRHHVFLKDNDMSSSSSFSVTVANDSSGILQTVELIVFPSRQFLDGELRNDLPLISIIDINLQLNVTNLRAPASVYVHVTDIEFHPQTSNIANTVILKLNVVPSVERATVEPVDTYTARLSKNATRFAQVLRLSNESGQSWVEFSINKTTPYTTMLAITPHDGIVYVSDPALLQAFDSSFVEVVVDVVMFKSQPVQKIVVISLLQRKMAHNSDCELSCSRFNVMTSCQSACGLGTETGLCRWRPGEPNKMSSFFQTCTPSIETCADMVCDDVERLNKYICPQDCTKVGPRGVWLKNSVTGQGIVQAKGTCWCDHKAECTCSSMPHLNYPLVKNDQQSTEGVTLEVVPTDRDTAELTTEGVTIAEDAVARLQFRQMESCNRTCRITVGTTITCLMVFVLIGFSVWWVCRRQHRRSRTLKHVASIISMTALPSDYVEERERRSSNISHQCSPNKKDVGDFDAKWEFPRQHLVLEETLGEGEFGQVVKARAWGLEGDEKWSQVAIKMLKPDASGSEFQDLWSELNLLKEVNHPNVIRLLGACTQSGPFYVIVEFCQYGCLKSYLRSARFNGRPSWDERQDTSGWHRKRNVITLTFSRLLSFSWQIAKGMEYLSVMKLIHRDLAARNVLVAEHNLLKISDFGLSRDVYEADTYLKMSKGRIPVKWMAPESLYAQIYTTKSDIWSFGIVLWEITTLGANPYPGIVPERLFSLLKTGYRMDRPDDCTEEMYAIMQKCWKTLPEQRPTFTLLANILDRMLQQHREYLELNNEVIYVDGELSYGEEQEDVDDFKDGYGSISMISPIPRHLTEIPECAEETGISDCDEDDAFLPKCDQSSAASRNSSPAMKPWTLRTAAGSIAKT